MKIINKISILILALCLAMSSSVFAFKDVEGTNYEDEAKLLAALGILNGYSADEFGGEKSLTRAEFATVLTRMMGYSDDSLESPAVPIYTDVPVDHWASANIYKAYTLGIMTGKGDGSFAPEENVLYNEAIKVMVIALGFEEIALGKGGYPSGYKAVAISEDVDSGTSASSDGTITRGNIAKLVYNTLHTYCLEAYGISNEDALLEQKRMLIEKTLDIKYASGVVRAYGDISLNNADNLCPEGRFILGDSVLFTGETNPSPYIGKNVGVYYKENNREYTAVYIMDSEKLSIEKTVPAELISTATTLTQLVYRKEKNSNSLSSYKISAQAEILYNNRLLMIRKSEDLHIAEGQVRLIDNNRDGVYDVVFIEEFETYIAESVAATTMTVNTKFGKGRLELDEEKNNISVEYYLDGQPCEFTDIAKDNVLDILKSKNIDGTVIYRIYISQTTAEGTAAGISMKNNVYNIVLDSGETFELNSDFMKRINGNNAETVVPEAGKSYVYYIDRFGKVAYIKNQEDVLDYGYLQYCKVFSSAFEDTSKFRIFTKNAEFVEFTSKDNILFNGVKTPSSQVVGEFTDAFGETVSQLIIYKANENNEITEIKKAVDKTSELVYAASEGEFVLNHSREGGLRFYKSLAENKPYYFASGTIQFMVPTDKSSEKDYKIMKKISGTDTSLPGPLKIYNVAAGGAIGVIVTGTSAASSDLSTPRIVDSFGKAIDENGEPCNVIYFFGGTSAIYNEEDITYNVPAADSKGANVWLSRANYSNVKIGDLKKGDVIEYTLTENNEIDLLRIILRASDIGLNRTDGDHIAENGNMIGDVVSIDEARSAVVLHTTDRFGTEQYQSMKLQGTVYRYSAEDDEVYNASAKEVEVGDKILINSYWWSPKLVYIIR